MTDISKRRAELERASSALVDSLSASLDAKNLELLRDFIENREYGVALEWLHSLVVRLSIPLSPQQKEEFQRLAQLLQIDLK